MLTVMNNVLVDTHRLFEQLKSHGFTEEQASGLTEAVREIDLSGLALRSDVQSLRDRVESSLRELELRITLKLGGLITAGIAVLAAMEYSAR